MIFDISSFCFFLFCFSLFCFFLFCFFFCFFFLPLLEAAVVGVQASIAPLTVTIVDRPYKAGRHILNVQELQTNIKTKFEGRWACSCNCVGFNVKYSKLASLPCITARIEVQQCSSDVMMSSLQTCSQGGPTESCLHNWAATLQCGDSGTY